MPALFWSYSSGGAIFAVLLLYFCCTFAPVLLEKCPILGYFWTTFGLLLYYALFFRGSEISGYVLFRVADMADLCARPAAVKRVISVR